MKIESLTQQQIDKFPEYVKKYIDIGLSTERADRVKAEKSIKEMYKISKLEDPKIVWCDSPLSAILTISIFEKLDKITLKDSVRNSVLDSVWVYIRDFVWDSVCVYVRASLGKSVCAPIGDSIGDSVRNSVFDSVMYSVENSVRSSVENSVRNSVMDSIGDSVRAYVGESVCAPIGDSVWNSVEDSLMDSVGSSVLYDIYLNSIEGSHLSSVSAFYLFFRNECGLIEETDNGLPFYDLIESCGWIFPYKNICFASERHSKLNRDSQGRIHSENSAAIEYPDGWKTYAIHGVRVPEYIVISPEKITVDLIEKENNVEIRRIMIDRYPGGIKKYFSDCNAVLIDEQKDIHSGLPIKLWKKDRKNDSPIVMVEMKNKTKESNDNGEWVNKSYYIRVKPDITDAIEAISWHHNQSKEDYLLTQKGT